MPPAKIKEIWKSPPSMKTWWVEISNLGRVRTVPHIVEYKYKINGKVFRRKSKIRGGLRKPSKDSRGRFIGVWGGKLFLIHRLVAECFVINPNPTKYNMVFFKNGDVSDCRAENLEWGDMAQKKNKARGNSSHWIITIFDHGKKAGEYLGAAEVGRALGVTKQAVWQACCRGLQCQGFILKRSRANWKEEKKPLGRRQRM